MDWIGIIFLISTFGTPLAPPYGFNDEHFNSEKDCWRYFDEHPSFSVLKKYDDNFYFYTSNLIIKLYEIKNVEKAWITCIEKNEMRKIPPWSIPPYE